MNDPDDFLVRVAEPRVSTRRRETPSSTIRLLRAVKKHQPYAGETQEAQRAAWQLVRHEVWGLREGKFEFHLSGTSFWKRFFKIWLEPSAGATEDNDGDCEAEASANDLPTRRRLARHDTEAARPPRKTRKVMKAQKTRPNATPRRDVDHASDEQFVDLLLEHAPHLAEPKSNAWAHVAAKLPVQNALHGRNVQALGSRCQCLKRAMESLLGSKFRDKLTPRLEEKLQRYAVRITRPPTQDADQAEPPPLPARGGATAPPPSSSILAPAPAEDEAPSGTSADLCVSTFALATHVENNVHRELSKVLVAMERRLDMVANLTKLVKQQHARGGR